VVWQVLLGFNGGVFYVTEETKQAVELGEGAESCTGCDLAACGRTQSGCWLVGDLLHY